MSKIAAILFCVGSAFAYAKSAHAAGYLSGWTYQKQITISNTNVGSVLSYFPLLVHISDDSNIGAGVSDTAHGYDIRFTDSSGTTTLPYEREDFSVSGGAATGDFWVQVPSISSSATTTIYIYYDNASAAGSDWTATTTGTCASGTTEAQCVWKENGAQNYAGVWHFPNGVTLSGSDSTGNANATSFLGSPSPTATTNGKIYGGANFNGSSAYTSASAGGISYSSPWTISMWAQLNTTPALLNLWSALDSSGNFLGTCYWETSTYGGMICTRRQALNTYSTQSASAITDTNPHLWTFSYDGSSNTMKIYVDGTDVSTAGTTNLTSVSTGNNKINLSYGLGGGFQSQMTIDEMRLSLTARSPQWIKFEYCNQLSAATSTCAGNNELTFSGQQTNGPSISANVGSILQNSTGNSMVLTGYDTSWTAGTPGSPTFTLSGGTGASITAQTVSSTTGATLTVSAGSGVGPLIITDPSTQATTTINVVAPSTADQVTSFTFPSSITSTVNNTNHTIDITVPSGTNVTSLISTIAVSAGATISPASGVAENFTSPQTYTVTAQDGITQQAYTVTVGISKDLLYDTFNDTTGTLLQSHVGQVGATWTKAHVFSSGSAQIYNSGSGTTDAYTPSGVEIYLASATSTSSSYSMTLVQNFKSIAGSSQGVAFGYNSAATNGYILIYSVSDLSYELYRSVSGSFTEVASSSFPFVAGSHILSVNVSGVSSITVTATVDGVQIINYTDNTPPSGNGYYWGLWFSSATAATDTTGVHASSIAGTASVALTLGNASLTSATASTLNLSVGTAGGGVTPLTYQWYRSSTADFTPGVGTLLSGAASTTLADTPPSNGPWFYKCIVTDFVGSTVTSNQVGGTLASPVITQNAVSGSISSPTSILVIGDSITFGYGLSAGQDPVTQMASALSNMLGARTVIATNQGHSGSQTSDWLPGSGTGYLTSAITAAQALSPVAATAMITLGANDAGVSNHVASSTYESNLSTIISYLLGHGFSKVILNDPTYIPSGANGGASDEGSTLVTQQYIAQLASLVNGTTILAGDSTAYPFFQDNLADLQADEVHPTATGAQALGTMWATAALKALGVSFTPISSFSGQTSQNSSTTVLSLNGWASTGSQTITLTSDTSTDVLTASTTSGSGTITYTMPIGTSFIPYTINRSSAGTSIISVTNAQNWNDPSSLTYTIPSSDAALSGLTINHGVLAPAFASGTIVYASSLTNSVSSLTVTPTADQSNATITVDGIMVASGSASGLIPLSIGTTIIPIIVTAQDGVAAKTYTITVTVTAIPANSTVTTNVSYAPGGGSASISELAKILAPGPATTAYLNSLAVSTGIKPVATISGTFTFTRILKFGMTGNDVKQLQIFLNTRGFIVAKKGAGSVGHETTFFGSSTATALMEFQQTYKKLILIPQGLTNPTGIFGVATMKLVNGMIQ